MKNAGRTWGGPPSPCLRYANGSSRRKVKSNGVSGTSKGDRGLADDCRTKTHDALDVESEVTYEVTSEVTYEVRHEVRHEVGYRLEAGTAQTDARMVTIMTPSMPGRDAIHGFKRDPRHDVGHDVRHDLGHDAEGTTPRGPRWMPMPRRAHAPATDGTAPTQPQEPARDAPPPRLTRLRRPRRRPSRPESCPSGRARWRRDASRRRAGGSRRTSPGCP